LENNRNLGIQKARYKSAHPNKIKMQNENSKFETLLIITLFSFCFFNLANAYNDQTTHPALTEEIVNLYNFYYPNSPITSEQKEWII
jgi:hypothetical protein